MELDGGQWERLQEIKITVDSGAVDTVGPPDIAPGSVMWETQASQAGKYYRAANNTNIPIYGMKELRGCTRDGEKVGMDMQIAQVKKALASVRRICEGGNRVVFDMEGSYIENKLTGKRTNIEQGPDGYTVSIWIPKPDFRRQEEGSSLNL